MELNGDKLSSILSAQLTPEEREKGVAYTLLSPVASGTTLEFPRCTIRVPWDAMLAFVDRQPLANWGHSCRYILINSQSGVTTSIEARFPPFRRDDERRWRVVYQAPTVPDTALAVPK
jgi:hypothetical protein